MPVSSNEALDTGTLVGLRLRDFRNYEVLDIELGPGFHVVAGRNAQGKTNLLEALYLLSTTRLLRGSKDTEAIRQGAQKATAEADAGRTQVSISLEHGARKRAALNSLNLPRASDLIGRLPCVCVSSADLPIVSGEPSDRRLFLDLELSQTYPAYLRHFTLYKRALEQRNALLKLAQDRYVDNATFEAWEIQLADHGAAMREFRRRYTDELTPLAQEVHASLGHGELLGLAFEPKEEAWDADALFLALTNRRGEDIQRKTTTVGPHRDELRIAIEGKEGRTYGSQGQQRSAVIAIKLATLHLLSGILGRQPLLLLDDILSDLDATRRARLSEWVVAHAGQVVLTCTEEESVGPQIRDVAMVFHVDAGRVTSASS
jgi:DNA replication and repair protein RecF